MMYSPLTFVLFVALTFQSTVAIEYSRIGCYRDTLVKPRPLPELIENFRGGRVDWNNLNNTIAACAEAAKKKGYLYFGLQFYGECWSGPQAQLTYARDGPSKNCSKGVGEERANFVYKIKLLEKENECTTYRVLDSADRSKTNVNTVSQGDKCDHWNSGFVRNAWYRFTGAAGQTMADECVQAGSCQTTMAGWMNGTHPKVFDGIQRRKACFSSESNPYKRQNNNCCERQINIHVRNCGEFYVYKLPSTPGCFLRYCGSGVSQNKNA